jgi:hypothetical protein
LNYRIMLRCSAPVCLLAGIYWKMLRIYEVVITEYEVAVNIMRQHLLD